LSSKEDSEAKNKEKKKPNWFKISLFANILFMIGIGLYAGGAAVIHQSDTNPQFCALCHVMRPNVESYTSGHTLDNVHAQAGVECKECHDYPLAAEIESGLKYITGNYYIDGATGEIPKREFGDEMCTKCHGDMDKLANQTDYLRRNPHLSHNTDLQCGECHLSHAEQSDYCGQCHDNGGQRMTGGEIIPRADNPWADPNRKPPDTN